MLLDATVGSAAAGRTVLEAGVTNFDRVTWKRLERVGAGDTIDVTFVMKTCPKLREKFEAKVGGLFSIVIDGSSTFHVFIFCFRRS